LTAFRAVSGAEAFSPPHVLDLSGARVTFISGSLRYQAVEVVGSVLDQIKIRPQMRETPRGTYVLISAPFAVGEEDGEEPRTREAIAAAAGLVSAIKGGGLIFEFVFENIFDLESGELTGFTSHQRTPVAFGPPRVASEDMTVTAEAAAVLEGLDEPTQGRVALSLHWQHQSVREEGPRNEFIAMWTGIEALAMPDTTNVKPANELLARAYGITARKANDRFGLGRLQGFRSDILHGDSLPGVHADVLGYLRAIFTDLLLAVGLPSQGRAQAFIEAPLFGQGFDLARLLGNS
jgi:hypothetical protein